MDRLTANMPCETGSSSAQPLAAGNRQ